MQNIAAMPDIRTVHLQRHRFLPNAGGGTVFCIMTYDGRPGPALAFLKPGQFPEFEGESAWFQVQWFNKHKREFVRRIEQPAKSRSQAGAAGGGV